MRVSGSEFLDEELIPSQTYRCSTPCAQAVSVIISNPYPALVFPDSTTGRIDAIYPYEEEDIWGNRQEQTLNTTDASLILTIFLCGQTVNPHNLFKYEGRDFPTPYPTSILLQPKNKRDH